MVTRWSRELPTSVEIGELKRLTGINPQVTHGHELVRLAGAHKVMVSVDAATLWIWTQ